jgi:hypothetical protein
MKKLPHAKKRNIGLVYEFLTREVSGAVVAKDDRRAARAMSIIARHLGEDTELSQELSLHRGVMESRGVSERLARRIVDELKAAGVRLSVRRELRNAAKSALIHEMNRELGRDIFDRYRVPDYTAHASVSILMSRGLDARLDEGVDVARVEDHLIGFLTSVPTEAPRFDRDATVFAYRNAVGMFESEYGAELTAPQGELIREYVRVSLGGNRAPFERTFARQRETLREFLRIRRQDEVFRSDPDMAGRLDEAIADLTGLEPTTEEAVERLMNFHQLRREIES